MMEKVKCINCGSVGYTAAPECVRCSVCGGRHRVITQDADNHKPVRIENIHYLEGLAVGSDSPGTLCRD